MTIMSFIAKLFGFSSPKVEPIQPLPPPPDLSAEESKRSKVGLGSLANIFTTSSLSSTNQKKTLLGD